MVLKLSSVRTIALFLLVSALSACLGTTPPQRLAQPETIAVHIILEDASGRRAATPREVIEAVDDALSARNLVASHVPAEAFQTPFADLRASQARFDALVAAAPDAAHHLLVQANARYFTQIAGRFRWDVDLRILAAGRGAAPQESSVSIGAHLIWEHERESEALTYIKRQVADEVGLLVDRILSGRTTSPPAAASDATPTTGATATRDALYFVMIDRFADGDDAAHPGEDRADPAAWHGGDLRGLISRLDWLDDLGVGAVWLSPPFATRGTPFFGHGAFHGYWTERLDRIDPRFGSEQHLRDLAMALRARGLGLWLDVVLNHVGPEAPLLHQHPDWFRPARPIDDWNNPVQLEHGQVHGLPDLDQDHPAVRAYLGSATHHWLDGLALDGLRLDAVKHIGATFWHDFNTNLRADRPGLSLLGEILDGDPVRTETIARAGAFDAIFDFALHHGLVDTFCRNDHAGALASALSVALELDDAARAQGQPPLVRYAFLDNHDLPRVASVCKGDLDRVAAAFDALVALPARPAITWGTEVALDGATEPENRKSMVFQSSHPLRARIRAALARRASNPALTTGTTRIEGWHEAGAVVWSRTAGETATLVVANPTAQHLRIATPAWPADPTIDAPPNTVAFVQRPAATTPVAATVPVTFRIAAAPATVRVIGASPRLGAWNPAHAPTAANGILKLDLPPGRVYALKLVATPNTATTTWEQRPNRHIFVAGPMTVDLTWEA
jgi:glycosidase